MEHPRSKMLLNDKPIQVGRHCAKLLGLTEAAVLQTLHWHILEYMENAHRAAFVREYFYQGHWWYKGTYQQMVTGHAEQARGDFDFLPISTLRRTLYALEARSLIISQEIVSNGSHGGKRYRLNHEALNALADATSASELPQSGPQDPHTEQAALPFAGEASAQSEQTLFTERLPKVSRVSAHFGQTTLPKVSRVSAQSEQTCPLKTGDIESSSESCKSHHQTPGAQTQAAANPNADANDDDALYDFLVKHALDPPGARQLVADGLTIAQAEIAVAKVQQRGGIRKPGAAIFTACRDMLAGHDWQDVSAGKAGNRLRPRPPAEPKSPAEPAPIPDAVKATFAELRKKTKPGGVSGPARADHEQRGQEQRDAEEARREFLREQVRQLEAQDGAK